MLQPPASLDSGRAAPADRAAQALADPPAADTDRHGPGSPCAAIWRVLRDIGGAKPALRFPQQTAHHQFDAYLECGILAHGFLAPALRRLRPRQALGVQLQAPRVLPLVRGAVYVADRRASGRSRHPADGEPVFVKADSPTDEELQALLHKIITRLMKLLTRRGVLVEEEEEGSSYLADANADSDEARSLRPLQAAAWPCRPRLASGQAPRARHRQSTGLSVSELGLPRRLRPTRRAEGVHGARCDAARRRAHPSAVCRPSGFQRARGRALRCPRAPAAGAAVPVHHAAGAGSERI